jgi:hypothetical protein
MIDVGPDTLMDLIFWVGNIRRPLFGPRNAHRAFVVVPAHRLRVRQSGDDLKPLQAAVVRSDVS